MKIYNVVNSDTNRAIPEGPFDSWREAGQWSDSLTHSTRVLHTIEELEVAGQYIDLVELPVGVKA